MLPFSQHPGRHRSQILHDGRLDRVDELGSEVLRHLHQQRLVDQVPLGAVRHRVPAIVQMPEQTFGSSSLRDIAVQELIEEVDVDVAKLFLESGHAGPMVAENGGTAVVFRRRG